MCVFTLVPGSPDALKYSGLCLGLMRRTTCAFTDLRITTLIAREQPGGKDCGPQSAGGAWSSRRKFRGWKKSLIVTAGSDQARAATESTVNRRILSGTRIGCLRRAVGSRHSRQKRFFSREPVRVDAIVAMQAVDRNGRPRDVLPGAVGPNMDACEVTWADWKNSSAGRTAMATHAVGKGSDTNLRANGQLV
jgi:hypothetical protein